ncbi:MAG: helix-turn-helix transcriptional regulator [Desulfohalobiaceae bacterium]|nr:helix-turn-helix transcriptional regulator [Desulfohalobiaceae bacterium]
MISLLSTREVAELLGIHEKKVYKLIHEQGLPGTKITGKWLFPRHLVEQWLENNTINYPGQQEYLSRTPALFVVAGSNDPLLDRTLNLFMAAYPEYTAVFGNLGSMGGLRLLRQGLCHLASSHLAREDLQDFNFSYAAEHLDRAPAVVNFCRREQGLLLARGNPKHISSIADLSAHKDLRIVNRSPGTGTRLWFDRALKENRIDPAALPGYEKELQRHLDVGLEILSGRADLGPGIRTVAGLLDLDFLPMHWERFDLLISRERFFDENIQAFLGLLHDERFRELARGLGGYDLGLSGQMLHPIQKGQSL